MFRHRRRVQFLAFSATQLDIAFGAAPNEDSLNVHALVTLSGTARKEINLVTQPVTLKVGTFTTTIPSGSFTGKKLDFNFTGVIDGVSLDVLIKPTGSLRYAFTAKATGANLNGTENAVYVTLTVGDNSGATSVTAKFSS